MSYIYRIETNLQNEIVLIIYWNLYRMLHNNGYYRIEIKLLKLVIKICSLFIKC